MKGFIYITTNNITGKKYIGKKYYYYSNGKESNWRTYLGSSKLLKKDIDLFGVENFSKEIIDEAETAEGLALLEKHYLDEVNAAFNNDYYNLSNSVDKFFTTEDSIKRMIETRKRWSDEKKLSVSNKLKQSWLNTYEQRCDSMKKYQSNRTDKQKSNFRKTRSKVQKEVWTNMSDQERQQYRDKLSDAGKRYWSRLTYKQRQEHIDKRKHALEKMHATNRAKTERWMQTKIILVNVKENTEKTMTVRDVIDFGIPYGIIRQLLNGKYSTHNLYKRSWTLISI